GGALFFRGLADRVVDMLTRSPGAQSDPASRGRALNRVNDQAIAAAIWDLVWAGMMTNDTLAPLRTVLSAGKSWAPGPRPSQGLESPGAANGSGSLGSGSGGSARPSGQPSFTGGPARPSSRLGARRPGFGRGSLPSHAGPPTVSGRWSLVPRADTDPTRRL